MARAWIETLILDKPRRQEANSIRAIKSPIGIKSNCQYHHANLEINTATKQQLDDNGKSKSSRGGCQSGFNGQTWAFPSSHRDFFRLEDWSFIGEGETGGRTPGLESAHLEPIDMQAVL
jgi:hypothetical protein